MEMNKMRTHHNRSVENLRGLENGDFNGDGTSKYNDPKASPDKSVRVNVMIETSFVRDTHASSQTLVAERGNNNVVIETLVRDVTGALQTPNASKGTGIPIAPFVTETSHTTALGAHDIKQVSPRFSNASRMRLRDSSSYSEFEGMNKKLKTDCVCEFHAKGWCIKGNSCRFLHIRNVLDAAANTSEVLDREVAASSSARILLHQSEQNLDSESSKFVDHEKDMLGSSSLQANGGSSGLSLYSKSHIYGAAVHRDNIYGGCSSDHPIIPNDNLNVKISSFGTSDEMTGKKSNLLSPYSRYRQPISFASSSWNNHAGASSNFLEPTLKLHAPVSLEPNTTPVLGSEAANISGNHPLMNTEPTMDKTKVISDDWEPSLPFLPSHFITQNLLLKASLREPIREYVELKDVNVGPVKFSSSDQGSSVQNLHPLSHNSQEEVKHLGSAHVEDAVKYNLQGSSSNNKLKIDDQRHVTRQKIDESGKSNEIALDFGRDEQNESKSFKSFHVALIECVKELIKPTWRQGLMSKDAHKMIVKKCVEKVLSTIQSDQFPSTPESVNLYLSSSHEKLSRLVEAYIGKYGKN